jgi:Family of unknown function (DUF5331)
VNTKQLRQSVKEKWLDYYRENREWIARLATWGNYNGQRRPSSSFILASLSVLEPDLPKLLPILVDLNNDPDRLVAVLGLNFNPETELNLLSTRGVAEANGAASKLVEAAAVKQLLPGTVPALDVPAATSTPALISPLSEPQLTQTAASSRSITERDADCRGTPQRRQRGE